MTYLIRGYIAGYGPYASLSWQVGESTLPGARRYFDRATADTNSALITLTERNAEGWERELDRWRPDPADLEAERDVTGPAPRT